METVETPSAALVRVTQPLGETRAAMVRESFGKMLDTVEAWTKEAAGLVVTSEDQKRIMQRARSLRLEIKDARVELEKKRKDMKSVLILEGRAIDGAFAIFESLSAPLEKHLLEQEKFAERAEGKRRDALRDARKDALLAMDMLAAALPAALGEMSEDAWQVVLDDAKAAKEARAEQARIAEAGRVEASRIAAEKDAERRAAAVKAEAERVAREEEQRAENDRLRAEAAAAREATETERRRVEDERRVEREQAAAEQVAAEAKAKAERDADEAKHAAEREAFAARERAADEARAREAAEREKEAAARKKAEEALAAKKLEDEERVQREVEQKKPTKAKYLTLLTALRQIRAWTSEPHAAEIASKALDDVGEGVPKATGSGPRVAGGG
jgi:hypothetical protein